MAEKLSAHLATCIMGMYTSPTTALAATNVYADFTAASNMPAVTLSSWGAVATDGNGKASMTHANVTWTQTAAGTQTLQGYYVYTGTSLVYAEKFATAITVVASGDEVRQLSHVFRLYN